MAGNQFDQIYHEHFSYFAALTAEKILAAHGMRIFDLEELWNGGSLRIYACHAGDATHPTEGSVSRVKGNTLFYYCGIRTDFLDYTVDRNPYKRGKYLPGTHIPIFPPEKIAETKPDYVLILPWNLKDEITARLPYIRDWDAKFAVPIPEVSVI
jgi:hypothetical protein